MAASALNVLYSNASAITASFTGSTVTGTAYGPTPMGGHVYQLDCGAATGSGSLVLAIQSLDKSDGTTWKTVGTYDAITTTTASQAQTMRIVVPKDVSLRVIGTVTGTISVAGTTSVKQATGLDQFREY